MLEEKKAAVHARNQTPDSLVVQPIEQSQYQPSYILSLIVFLINTIQELGQCSQHSNQSVGQVEGSMAHIIVGTRHLPLFETVWTVSGVHPMSYSVCVVDFPPGLKWQRVRLTTAFSAEVNNVWNSGFFPTYAVIACTGVTLLDML